MTNDSQSHLYMLVHETEPMFKIGIANDIKDRAKQIGQKINYSASFFSHGTRESVSIAERVLHKLLRNTKVDRVAGSGGTEWFSIEHFDTARDTLEKIRNLAGVTQLAPIGPDLLDLPPPAKPSRISKADKYRLLLEKKRERRAKIRDAQNQNKDSLGKLRALAGSLIANSDSLICIGPIHMQELEMNHTPANMRLAEEFHRIEFRFWSGGKSLSGKPRVIAGQVNMVRDPLTYCVSSSQEMDRTTLDEIEDITRSIFGRDTGRQYCVWFPKDALPEGSN